MRKLGKGEGASPRLQMRLPQSLHDALVALAGQDRRSLPDYVRLALEDHVAAKKKRR